MPLKASAFPIFKLSATGNDFLLVDLRLAKARAAWKKTSGGRSRVGWVKTLCDRHEGLGADGMVFLEADREVEFAWDFYNSDGGRAEMCGNAARAVSLYARRTGSARKFQFRTRIGLVDASVAGDHAIEVSLPPIREEKWSQHFKWMEADLPFDFVRAGVPHAVVPVVNLEPRAKLRELAVAVKQLAEFAKAGTNVTFVRPISPRAVESVTFERGVEDFTLSCGTGAVAAAHTLLRGQENQHVQVRVPGGALTVVWRKGRPHLKGPAKIVAEMHLCP